MDHAAEEGNAFFDSDTAQAVNETSVAEDDARSETSVIVRSDMRPIESPFRTHPFSRSITHLQAPTLEPSPSLTSIGSVDLNDILLPLNDPLLDTPPSPSSSSNDSWESTTDSDSAPDAQDHDGAHDVFLNLDPRFIDYGWGGECLRETEDIDFEFVYALHTFVATVEGQANATKGDTMVLLDDSNSYWWLVRVVKDSSIGYLPAEHIETPTERLARLNKHRNIDLSATMLSDNSEKSRNPIKKAMRRRNAKTVQFAAPTYVEASDYDYSTEDEEHAMIDSFAGAGNSEEPQQNGHADEPNGAEINTTENGEEPRAGTPTNNRGSFDREQAATLAQQAAAIDEPQLSPKLIDKTEAAPLKSRKGTPRNTDSFLKDDSIETRKITLTPGLLREDSMSIKSASSESVRNNSTENLVKNVAPLEQASGKKDIKDKKKEKAKGGMLSGLFKSKKKDKKVKDEVSGTESDMEKPSIEVSRESPRASPLSSGGNSPVEKAQNTMEPRQMAQARQQQPASRGKLQKQQPPSQTNSPVREKEVGGAFLAELPAAEVAYEMAGDEPDANELQRRSDAEAAQLQESTREAPQASVAEKQKDQKPKKAKRAKQRMELDDFDEPAEEEDEEKSPNPFVEQAERSQQSRGEEDRRERLSDSPVQIMPGTFMHGTEIVHIPTPGEGPDEEEEEDEEPESLTSSPSIIEHPSEPDEVTEPAAPSSFAGLSRPQANRLDTAAMMAGMPGGMPPPTPMEEYEEEPRHEEYDDAETPPPLETEDNDATPTAPRSPQPESIPPATNGVDTSNKSSTPGLSASNTPDTNSDSSDFTSHLSPPSPTVSQQSAPIQWSDSSLRAWMDDPSELRDMLLIIHDKTDVKPVSADHPMMAGLFVEERKGVQRMGAELDGLLGRYLQRKGISYA